MLLRQPHMWDLLPCIDCHFEPKLSQCHAYDCDHQPALMLNIIEYKYDCGCGHMQLYHYSLMDALYGWNTEFGDRNHMFPIESEEECEYHKPQSY